MKITLKQIITKFDALQPRERIVLTVAIAGLLYFLVNLLLLNPEQKKQKQLLLQIATEQKELSTFNTTNSQISSQLKQDPLAQARATRDNLLKSIAEADKLLGQVNTTTPQVDELVKTMINASPGLTLVSLKTLPVATFYISKVSEKPVTKTKRPSRSKKASATEVLATPQPSIPLTPIIIYKHGVEVSFKGNYLAMLPYLQNLQNYPKRLFWYDAKLDVTVYPESVLKITIYTTSEEPSALLG